MGMSDSLAARSFRGGLQWDVAEMPQQKNIMVLMKTQQIAMMRKVLQKTAANTVILIQYYEETFQVFLVFIRRL